MNKPLFSQRRELLRVIHWLRSERFKCDHSSMQFNQAAAEIAALIEDGTYEKDTEWSRELGAPAHGDPEKP